MNDNGQEFTGLNYEMLVEDSLRMVVRSALRITEMSGLPGETHFYIGFKTSFAGVTMDEALRADHPESITIVIQHQFSDLLVEDDQFTITLFWRQASTMTVPFAAITSLQRPIRRFWPAEMPMMRMIRNQRAHLKAAKTTKAEKQQARQNRPKAPR